MPLDSKRAAVGAARSAAAMFDAGMDTYATKRYGEDWDDYHDPDMMAEEFDGWLEGKGDDEF